MNWFEQFKLGMKGENPTLDLIGAKSASAQIALEHYRYQHQSKIREAIEETFPQTKIHMGEKWESLWTSFWESKPHSPRSLDFFGEVFLQFIMGNEKDLATCELARFEWAMEIHPWTHERLKVLPLPSMDEETKLVLAPLDIQEFSYPVMELYQTQEIGDHASQRILFWMKESGLHFRRLTRWEEDVLKALPFGLGLALEHAPEDQEAVAAFFQWLGSSGLVQERGE
ncbi:MAG: putative DNA-binding domain-containing protein [Bacteriovoracia bacterium]